MTGSGGGTHPPSPTRIVQEDPLTGGGGWYWVAAVLLAAAGAGGWWASRLSFEELHDSPVGPLAAFAGMLGIATLVFASYLTLRFRKFGHATLDAEVPVAGRAWKGVVRTGSDLAATGDYVITLSCEEAQRRPDSNVGGPVVVWKATCRVAPGGVRSSAGIPFDFAPPAEGNLTSSSGGFWWLEVKAPVTGMNFVTLFDVTPLLGKHVHDRLWWGEALSAISS